MRSGTAGARGLLPAAILAALLALPAAPSGAGEEAVMGNVAGPGEFPLLRKLGSIESDLQVLGIILNGGFGGGGRPALLDPSDRAEFLVRVRDMEACAGEILEALEGGSFQESTLVEDALRSVGSARRNLATARDFLEEDGLELAILRVLGRSLEDVRASRTALGGIRSRRGDEDAYALPDGPPCNQAITFEGRRDRRLEKTFAWKRDGDRKSVSDSLKVERTPSGGTPLVSLAAKRERTPRNHYHSFRGKRRADGTSFGFYSMEREWRGPFEYGFTAGLFRAPKSLDPYRGNAFLGVEVDVKGSSPLEFFSTGVRFAVLDEAGTQTGIQVFANGNGTPAGDLFLPGETRVDVRVVYDGSAFEAFVRPAGAPENAFTSFATWTHGGSGVVWVGGVGVANFEPRTELGIDDLYAAPR